MAFTVREFQDLVQLLRERADWREELRQTLLSDDFLALPGIVRELAEAQRGSEQRLRRTEQRVEELAEAQRRTEVEVRRLTNRVASLDGRMLEFEVARKAFSYFGRLLRRVEVINPNDIEDLLEARLPAEYLADILRLDLFVHGRLRRGLMEGKEPEMWLAVEVSVVVDREDVERVARRASLMRQGELQVLPVAVGENVTEGARSMAKEQGVILMRDGSMAFVNEALQRLTSPDSDNRNAAKQ